MQMTKAITLNTSEGSAIFEVQQLDGVTGMMLLIRLAKTIGPAALAGKTAATPEAGKAAMVAALLASIDPEEYVSIQNKLLSRTVARIPTKDAVINDVVPNLGSLFEGHVMELGKLVMFAIEANFGGFFGGSRAPIK
jgi:hypothetical protein